MRCVWWMASHTQALAHAHCMTPPIEVASVELEEVDEEFTSTESHGNSKGT